MLLTKVEPVKSLFAARRISGVVLCLAALLLLPTGVRADDAPEKDKAKKAKADYFKLMRTLVDTFEQIDRNYVKGVDPKKLRDAAIRGMLKELDPYSSYVSPDDIERFNRNVEQQFGGIGIQVAVDRETKKLMVLTPMPGTPAYRAGVLAGDIIEEIEGKTTKNVSLDGAIKMMKGPVGEAVTLTIRHAGAKETKKMSIVRDTIQIQTVLGDHYNKDGSWEFFIDKKSKIGYIRLTNFSRRSGDELYDAMKSLRKRGMKGLILDLRFNPGGLLSQAVTICDMFVEKGRIVSTKGRNSPERVWNANKAGTYSEFPMAVLVNRFSASASEITSACLQDHKRAIVIGERTWGKGSVQNVIELQGGKSALKLTTAGYFRPSGKNIHRHPGDKETDVWGVMPDKGYKIKFTTREIQQFLDERRRRDVIKEVTPPRKFKDRQLDSALKYLRGKIVAGGGKPKPGAAAPAGKKDAGIRTPKDAANRLGFVQFPKLGNG